MRGRRESHLGSLNGGSWDILDFPHWTWLYLPSKHSYVIKIAGEQLLRQIKWEDRRRLQDLATRKTNLFSMDRKERKRQRLTRQQSVTGKNIRPCDNFKSNLWRPNKCINCFFSAGEHASSSYLKADVNPYELQKLQDLFESGMIQEAEFERRKALLTGESAPSGMSSLVHLPLAIEYPSFSFSNPIHSLADSSVHSVSRGLASSSLALRSSSEPPPLGRSHSQSSSPSNVASSSGGTVPLVDEEAAEEVEDVLSGIIVVFFADGTDRYNDMTSYALRTFIDATPRIMAGLLTADEKTSESIVSSLAPSQRHRVLPKLTHQVPYFDDWNPTQYKLDIVQYADAFETIFWFDSDTITFGDMTEFLSAFAVSNAKFYLTPDHVNSDAEFCKRWTENVGNLCVVPQACLMGFKSDLISEFFSIWESFWQLWITPKPFANFADPNPTFEGSAFCIEQYALGQALVYKAEWQKHILWFKRKSIAVPRHGNAPMDTTPNRASSVAPLLKLIEASQHPENLINLKELRSLTLPPKTKARISNSIIISEHYDYIDRFGNLYHCYNHSYLRVRDWYQHFTAHGSSQHSSSSHASS